jgi:hypothetical protein
MSDKKEKRESNFNPCDLSLKFVFSLRLIYVFGFIKSMRIFSFTYLKVIQNTYKTPTKFEVTKGLQKGYKIATKKAIKKMVFVLITKTSCITIWSWYLIRIPLLNIPSKQNRSLWSVPIENLRYFRRVLQ